MGTNMTSDWVMVIITAIYVVATCFICDANYKSANASKEQLDEVRKQHAEFDRPNIDTELHYIQRTWYIIRFVNHGNKTAQHVRININQDFIDSLPEEDFRIGLARIQNKECIIGIGQHYDLFIGSNKLRGNPNLRAFSGTIEYESQGCMYKSDLFIDLENYTTFFTVTSEEEKILKQISNIEKDLKNINNTLSKLTTNESSIDAPIEHDKN